MYRFSLARIFVKTRMRCWIASNVNAKWVCLNLKQLAKHNGRGRITIFLLLLLLWGFVFDTLFPSVYDPNTDLCALEIHETCSKEFYKLMGSKAKKICKSAGKWFGCYSHNLRKGKYKNCNSQIINKYSTFIEKNGQGLIDDATSIANLCWETEHKLRASKYAGKS